MSTLEHYSNINVYLDIQRSIDYKHLVKFIDINLIDNIYYLKLEIDQEVNLFYNYNGNIPKK